MSPRASNRASSRDQRAAAAVELPPKNVVAPAPWKPPLPLFMKTALCAVELFVKVVNAGLDGDAPVLEKKRITSRGTVKEVCRTAV
jgi:hypothetical protein